VRLAVADGAMGSAFNKEWANNGMRIHAPLEGDAAYDGMEYQILGNTAAIYKELHKYQNLGSVYSSIPAKRGF